MAKRKKRTLGRGLMRFIFHLALLGAALYGIAMGVLWLAETHTASAGEETDAVIVLGAQVYQDGSLSPQLELRMEAALEAYRQNPRLIVTCGAQGGNEPAAEGEVMRAWLIAHGAAPGDVVAETNSYNTQQNLENARALLPENVRRVTIITSDYHLPRAMAIAQDLGLEAEGIGSPCKPEYWLKNHAREVLALSLIHI